MRNLIALITYFFTFCCFAQYTDLPDPSDPRFYSMYIHKDTTGGYGVIDQNGNWILPPVYEAIDMDEGRISARKNRKYALFTTTGKQLTDFLYDDLDLRHYGYGMNFIETMMDHRNYYGLIDTNGKEILPPIYSRLNAFYSYNHHKCISYCLGPDSCGMLDSNLQILIPPLYDAFTPIYSEFMEVVLDEKIGLFNYSGKQIGNDWYESIEYLIQGKYLPVVLNSQFGIINVHTGDYVVKPSYEKINSKFFTQSDDAFFYWENGLMGLMDTAGKRITQPIYQDNVYDYYSKTIAMMKDSLWGLIDHTGKVILPFEYDYINMDQRARINGSIISVLKVKKHGLYGFLWDNGKVIIKPQYSEVREFKENFVRVKKNGQWGLIDISGNMVIKPVYEELGGHYHERMVAKKKSKYGLIDMSGRIVVPFKYDYIEFYDGDSLLLVKENNLWGAMDLNGNLVIPIEYKYLSPKGYNRIVLYNYFPQEGVLCINCPPSKQGLADYKGKIIVPMKDYIILKVFPNGAAIFYVNRHDGYLSPDGKEKMLD